MKILIVIILTILTISGISISMIWSKKEQCQYEILQYEHEIKQLKNQRTLDSLKYKRTLEDTVHFYLQQRHEDYAGFSRYLDTVLWNIRKNLK